MSEQRRLVAWLTLWRFHFAPLSLATGLAGMLLGVERATPGDVAVGVAICFLGYGVAQAVNDIADRPADAINAPSRPLVSGALDPLAALAVTGLVAAGLALGAAAVGPACFLWSIAALVGHLLYTKVKGIPLLGNVTNGADLALFVLIGAATVRPDRGWLNVPFPLIAAFALCALVHSGFCLAGYFKDVEGDRAVGYRTLPVVLGPSAARWALLPFPALGLIGAAVLGVLSPDLLAASSASAAFWVLIAVAGTFFALGLAQLWYDPAGRAYEALLWYTRGAVLFPVALAASVRPALAIGAAVVLLGFFELVAMPTRAARQA